jgi:NADH-quinone oxidoreductase subunit F
MPAYAEEVQDALDEGVELMELVAPVRFVGNKGGKLTKIE